MVRRISKGSARKADVAEELETQDDSWEAGGVVVLVLVEKELELLFSVGADSIDGLEAEAEFG